MLKLCCCLLHILSGVITAYLMSKEFDPSDRDYLISGALSGGIAGFVNLVLDLLITSIEYRTMIPLWQIITPLNMGNDDDGRDYVFNTHYT